MMPKKILTIKNINTPEKAGLALKRLRKMKNISQAELAKLINMRQPTISDVESGKGTLDSFFKLVQALKLNFELSNQEVDKRKITGKSKMSRMLNYLEDKK
jgi:transcriptional regulator with XRE-family HTH domain